MAKQKNGGTSLDDRLKAAQDRVERLKIQKDIAALRAKQKALNGKK